LAQARRIKTEPSVVRINLLRFAQGILREIGFWLSVVIALGMSGALATFSPADPAWTQTASVSQYHNLGGAVGAWFADVTLYFLGYAGYLLPLGLVFCGWRLFKRGALLELDAEIVVLRVLGFAVTLASACGLAALHLRVFPGTVPGEGTAGGLIGVHVSQFLTDAFGFAGGNTFMAALLLASVTLTTGFSWLRFLDWIGAVVLKAVDWLGNLLLAPLRWDRRDDVKTPPPADSVEDATVAPTAATAPLAPPETSRPKPNRLAALARRSGTAAGGVAVALGTRAAQWWRARRAGADSRHPAVEPDAGTDIPPPASAAEPSSVAEPDFSTGRKSPRIEPVLDWMSTTGATGHASVHPVSATPSYVGEKEPGNPWSHPPSYPPAEENRNGRSGMSQAWPVSDLTLVPTSPAAPILPVTPVTPVVPAAPNVARRDDKALGSDEEEEMAAFEPEAGLEPRWDAPARPASFAPAEAVMVRRVAPPVPVAPYPLPSLDLLDRPPARTAGYSEETLEVLSRRVEALLKSFGIAARVVAVEPGPVITRFEIEPAPGVKVNQITNLAKDLARGLSVLSVRVVEIIPGKSVVGLEIPNQHREIVYLREVLEAAIYEQAASPLTLALGKDIGGNPVIANLGKMPHLLVAGTTGSGKSVAINAMLLSLLYKAPPHEVRLILVDPKMLELSIYEDIPHLLTPVVTDMKEAANALRWCVGEMERRYRLMAALKVRNIAGFNRKVLDALAVGQGLTDPFWRPGGGVVPGEIPLLQPLPFIVVVIDELADLMMVVGKKVEELIARLAQKARAAGIHLILATQRPSVDVITGLIKANIPTRIAFQVSARVDSRTILDQMGADQLLGHGDMLYLPPGSGLPQRVHGAFVDDHEVNRVVEYLRRTGAPDYVDEVLVEPCEESEGNGDGEGNGNGNGRNGESDPLYDEAVRIVTESRRVSVSGVQRRLRIGFNRAARLVEEMEAAGVVGPLQSNGSREVLAPPPP
jgi:DNA segregation ATPase FtsK/SpoIIIE, S-DNA-T family